MRPFGTVATAMLLAASAIGIAGPASTARAYTKEEIALNGTYRVTSIGNWAKINDQYNGEPTTVQTWTLSSTCTTFLECDGTMKSDEGWSPRLYLRDGTSWNVKRDVPNWERCQDGTAFTGKQTFSFYPADPDGSGVHPAQVAGYGRQEQDGRPERRLRTEPVARPSRCRCG